MPNLSKLSEFTIPTEVGPYRILRPLGEGGMGIVFEAVRDDIGRRVAIKVLKPEFASDEALARRFVNEARAVIQVNSSGIVQVFDFGQMSDGTPYIVMELLLGQTLASRLHTVGGHLTIAESLRIALEIARTLGAAHARSVIHRDLKPDNVMLVPDPEAQGADRVKLLDFGIAKLVSDTQGGGTNTCIVMGTPEYMSPEQCRGARDVDDRTDVYSLGVILYQMASGRRPFLGPSPGELIGQHQYHCAPSLGEIAPWVPASLVQLVTRMLWKEPDKRPSILAVSTELTRIAAGSGSSSVQSSPSPSSDTILLMVAPTAISSATPPLTAQLVSGASRRRGIFKRRTLAGVLVLLTLGGVVVWLTQHRAGSHPAPAGVDIHPAGQSLTRAPSGPEPKVVREPQLMTAGDATVARKPDVAPQPAQLPPPKALSGEPPSEPKRHRPGPPAKPLHQPSGPEAVSARPGKLAPMPGRGASAQDEVEQARDEARRTLAVQQSQVVARTAASETGEVARAKFHARRLFEQGLYKESIEAAEAGIRIASAPAEQAQLWHTLGLAACHQRNVAFINTAVKKLAAMPQLVQHITTECTRCGVLRNQAGVFR